MSGRKLHWLGLGLVTTAGAGVLALTAIMNSAFAYGDVVPTADPAFVSPFPGFPGDFPNPPAVTEVMGGSGLPIPPQSYINAVDALFINPNLGNTTPSGLFTPEGLYPLTGVKDLPLDTSVSRGVTILDDAIRPDLTAGTPVGVFGYSQSAIISSLEMEQLDPAGTPSNLPASFVLIGDIMNPNGGIFERFDGLQIPSLGLNFSGATPADDFPTTIYTLEYDGFADSPRYPINFLSDLNGVAGIEFVHGTYPEGGPAGGIGTPVVLPGSASLGTPDSLTNYVMIPVNNLPLLDPVRDVPVVGNPLADLIQPDLKPIVNLGYGDPNFGWSTAPANVPTQFGLFPSLSDFQKLPPLLLSGTQDGITKFIGDLTSGNLLTSLTSGPSGMANLLSDPTALLSSLSSPTDVINNISSAASTAYGTLLPTADILNATLTSIPAYDLSLFLSNIGDPINAIGLPVAADTGLLTLAGGVEGLVLLDAATTIAGDFGLGALTGLIPF